MSGRWSAPHYLMASQRHADDADAPSLTVKIADLGGAFYSNIKKFGMKAPELLDERSWDNKIDIWPLGCSLFHLAINEPLFPVMTFGCTIEKCRATLKDLLTQIFGHGYVGFATRVGERLKADFSSETKEQVASLLRSML
ncbi:hypothetical protein PENCOP_c006G03515 [Penicillium coprophilum]|uniref:Protein kinase domain-containing protein n=1 Tax=Penicillium coprophilum TaxID=36646 RepID=A0A1V6UNE3_9EURO|nr:hypothetical protein PENCOP_c006G03515 [Penicillium coprophilum]